MANPWDPNGRGPDLSRLPANLKEQLTSPIPLRPLERYARVIVFNRTPGLVHPTARLLATDNRSPDNITGRPDGVQVDAMDFTGRIPLVSFIMEKDTTANLLTGLLRSYMNLGGTEADIAGLVTEAKQVPQMFGVTKQFEEDANNE